jgi:hypothetical protein
MDERKDEQTKTKGNKDKQTKLQQIPEEPQPCQRGNTQMRKEKMLKVLIMLWAGLRLPGALASRLTSAMSAGL